VTTAPQTSLKLVGSLDDSGGIATVLKFAACVLVDVSL